MDNIKMSDIDDDLLGQNQLLMFFFLIKCKSAVSVSEINTQNVYFFVQYIEVFVFRRKQSDICL